MRAHTTLDKIEMIPKTPGVYLFYNSRNHLLYIGKSISLRTRVYSHLSAMTHSKKEKLIVQQTTLVEWEETGSELAALLREAALIKQYQPIYNRLLRKNRIFYGLKLSENKNGYLTGDLLKLNDIRAEEIPSLYGLSRHKRQLIQKLMNYTKEWNLCMKLLSLEKGKGPCFYFQIKRCYGACLFLETPAAYNNRLLMAFKKMRTENWPFAAGILIREKSTAPSSMDYHLIDKWCHIRSGTKKELLAMREPAALLQFDLDIYKILAKYILLKRVDIEVVNHAYL